MKYTEEQIQKYNQRISAWMGWTPNPHDGGTSWSEEVEFIDGELYSTSETGWFHPRFDRSAHCYLKALEKLQQQGLVTEIKHHPRPQGFSHHMMVTELKDNGIGDFLFVGWGDQMGSAIFEALCHYVDYLEKQKQPMHAAGI